MILVEARVVYSSAFDIVEDGQIRVAFDLRNRHISSRPLFTEALRDITKAFLLALRAMR